MTNSHEVINLETMAQCLADARTLLRDGDMCADTYISLLEEAARQIRSVLVFVQGLGLELTDEDETEAYAIINRCKAAKTHRRNALFQGGDFDLYLDLQDPWDTLVLESELGTGDGAVKSFVSSYGLILSGEHLPVSNFRNLCNHNHDDDTEVPARTRQIKSWLLHKGVA